jgi:hypothetical protein
MKKIGILTQPLHNNYGGLLQAYALQSYLKKTGNEVLTVDFQCSTPGFYLKVRGILSNVYRKLILKENIRHILPVADIESERIAVNTNRFKRENIDVTETITTLNNPSILSEYNFDAFVVGSDQVWRPIYSPGLPAFFLAFLDDNTTRRISYAASFGTDNCSEFTTTEIEEFSPLAKKFHALSVREDSAVNLCKDSFGVEAMHVIDPTMLLNKEDYELLVTKAGVKKSQGNLMSYVLDKNPEKQKVVDNVAKELSLKPFTVMPEIDGVYPPVEQWLRGFMDAEYVVTDSFHGVVFSIIFNKPFIAVGNASRGLARFESLLNMFSLTDRLVTGIADLTSENINQSIDYKKINKLRAEEQKIAGDFLKSALEESDNQRESSK